MSKKPFYKQMYRPMAGKASVALSHRFNPVCSYHHPLPLALQATLGRWGMRVALNNMRWPNRAVAVLDCKGHKPEGFLGPLAFLTSCEFSVIQEALPAGRRGSHWLTLFEVTQKCTCVLFKSSRFSVIYKEGVSQENALTLKAAKVIDAMIFHLTKVTPQNLNYLPSLPLCWDLFEEVSKSTCQALGSDSDWENTYNRSDKHSAGQAHIHLAREAQDV